MISPGNVTLRLVAEPLKVRFVRMMPSTVTVILLVAIPAGDNAVKLNVLVD